MSDNTFTNCGKVEIEWENHQQLVKAVTEYQAKVKSLQARIEQLKQTSEYWKAEHLAGNQRIAELESGISEVLQTWPPSGERVTLQLLLNPNMMAPQPPEER